MNMVSACAFPTAAMKVPLTVVKTPSRYVCMVCYCRMQYFLNLSFCFCVVVIQSLEQEMRQVIVHCGGGGGGVNGS